MTVQRFTVGVDKAAPTFEVRGLDDQGRPFARAFTFEVDARMVARSRRFSGWKQITVNPITK